MTRLDLEISKFDNGHRVRHLGTRLGESPWTGLDWTRLWPQAHAYTRTHSLAPSPDDLQYTDDQHTNDPCTDNPFRSSMVKGTHVQNITNRLHICNEYSAFFFCIIGRFEYDVCTVNNDRDGNQMVPMFGVTNMQFNYGTLAIDTATFHPQSIDAMVRRGVAHYLGNEMASKVVTWEESENKARKESGAAPVTDEEKAAKKAEYQSAGLTALSDGSVGASSRGPRVDPLTAATQSIAKREVLDVLKANGLKPPKGDESIEFANGTKKTMAEMVATRIAHAEHGPRINKEAAKKVADDERKAKKAKDEAAKRDKATPVNADDLGL